MDRIQDVETGSLQEDWHIARRDDSCIAQAIAEGSPIDAIYTLEDEAALDGFMHYLRLRDFVPHFERLAAAMRVERVIVPPMLYIWLYFAKVILGIKGMARMSPLLLRDEGLMRLVGFNAHQIANGVTRRGDSKRQAGTEREGPVSTEAISDNIVKLSVFALIRFFNGIIQRAVQLLIEDEEIDISVDCSFYDTTQNFEGATRVSYLKKVRDKAGKWVELYETHWGWKIGLAYHGPTGLPLALWVSKNNHDDRAHFGTLLGEVKKNLGNKRIRSVVMDRGFLDGEDLWRLNKQNIEFVIPLKTSMSAYTDAIDLARDYAEDPKHPEICTERWCESHVQGHGKLAKTVVVTTRIVGIPDLQTFDTYGPPGHGDGKARKDFKPNPINAVVVSEWRGRTFKTPKVFVTNGQVTKPRLTFDRYDDRSLIENGLFREGKQAWSLQSPPKRSEAGVKVHVYMTYVAMALSRCFKLEAQRQALPESPTPCNRPSASTVGPRFTIPTAPESPTPCNRPSASGKKPTVQQPKIASSRTAPSPRPVEPGASAATVAPGPVAPPDATSNPQSDVPDVGRTLPEPRLNQGMERYRLELKDQSRNKVILFRGDTYGILHVQEMAVLTGVNLIERVPGVGTRDEIFQKYGMEPPPLPPPVHLNSRPPSKSRRRMGGMLGFMEDLEDDG